MPKKQNPAGAVSPVLAMAAITALTQPQRIAAFIESANAEQRAFVCMGKLMLAIKSNLKKNESIYGVMRKAGVKDGTTSTAITAGTVYEQMVNGGFITEAIFDTFTWRDVLAIHRVSGPKSKKQLTLEEIAIVIGDAKDFEPELNCLFENGLTVAEQAAKVKADEAAAKAAIEAAKDPANPTTPAATAPTATTPAPTGTVEPAVPASNVTPMPAPKATADDAIRLIDTVESMIMDLSEEDQRRVAHRVIELAEIIANYADAVEKKPATNKKETAKAA